MQILWYGILDGIAVVHLHGEPPKKMTIIAYGMDELRRVLAEHSPNNERSPGLFKLAEGTIMPMQSTQPTLVIEGDASEAPNLLAQDAVRLTGAISISLFTDGPPSIIECMLPFKLKGDSGALCFHDGRGAHHIVLFYSKEQGRRIGSERPWLSAAHRSHFGALLDRCTLPEEDDRPIIDITGAIARRFNFGLVEGKMSSKPKPPAVC